MHPDAQDGKWIFREVSGYLRVYRSDIFGVLAILYVQGSVHIVELAIRGGAARVSLMVGGGGPSVRGCSRCGDKGHELNFYPTMGALMARGEIASRCWCCSRYGHRLSVCPSQSLLSTGVDGSLPRGSTEGGIK